MRPSQMWIVTRHELTMIRQRRSILIGLIAFPVGVSIGFPLLVRYILEKNGNAVPAASFLPQFLDAFGFWYVIGAVTLPVAIAAYSIVGEKVEKSLEPLLATPTTDSEILAGKTLAAFLPTMTGVWGGAVLFMVLMDRVTQGALGYLYYPNDAMAVILLALAPLAALWSILATTVLSARLTDVRSVQQLGGVMFLPFILLYLVGEVGALDLNATNLLYISGLMALFDLGLFWVSQQAFQREEILTQWK
jgi:ABC-2 type transport system permease protein